MRKGAAGFSLIEILVVVGLVAILAGMTAPAVSGALERYELISASQQVASTIRAARIQAVARNSRVRVRFDEEAGEYQNELWNGAGWVSLNDVNDLADGLSFTAPVNIQFETNGRIGAPVNIVVTNGTVEQNRTISVSTSGQVRLQ